MQLFNLFKKSPFSRFLIFYASGIFLAHTYGQKLPWIKATFTFSLLLVIFLFFILAVRKPGYRTGWVAGMFAGAALFVAGYLNMQFQIKQGERFIEKSGSQGFYVMHIVEPPDINSKAVRIVAVIKGKVNNGLWQKEYQKIFLRFRRDSLSMHLSTGDRLLATLNLTRIPPPGNPGEFDYQGYLANRGIYCQSYVDTGQWTISGKMSSPSLRIMAYNMQAGLLKAYQQIGLDNTLYSLLSAITLGYKNDLETQTKQLFSRAGVMHIMALSGFNVAVIALALNYLLAMSERFSLGKVIKTIVIILVIWLFVLVSGLSPSVTRAAVMLSFVLTGKLLHHRINTYNILFVSAFLLLALSPSLITDISFQLSFAAVLGIIVFQPVLYRMIICKNMVADKIWQLFCVSCAAQLSTLPLTLLYFHQFPVYFWLTNLYVVPLVSVIICTAGIYLLVSFIGPLMALVGKLLAVLLAILYKSVSFIEILPYSLIENIHISGVQASIIFMILLLLGFAMIQRKVKPLALALWMVVVFQFLEIKHSVMVDKQRLFLVGNIRGHSAISIISGREAIAFGDSSMYPGDPAVHYALNNYWIEKGVGGNVMVFGNESLSAVEAEKIHSLDVKSPWLGNNMLLTFSGHRIVVLKDNSLSEIRSSYPLNVDLVVVTDGVWPDRNIMEEILKAKWIVLDSSLKSYRENQWVKLCEELGIKYWQVSRQGAFVVDMMKGQALQFNHS